MESEKHVISLKKRVSDLNALKSTGHKVLEDKINKLGKSFIIRIFNIYSFIWG